MARPHRRSSGLKARRAAPLELEAVRATEQGGLISKGDDLSEGRTAAVLTACLQTIYNWRKKFGALGGDEVRRLKQLEVENGRLKKLVAERDLEIEVMKEIAAKKW